jgi:hypothetical protein
MTMVEVAKIGAVDGRARQNIRGGQARACGLGKKAE